LRLLLDVSRRLPPGNDDASHGANIPEGAPNIPIPYLMSGHFSISSDLEIKLIGCKKNKRGKKGKCLALFAPFVLFAAFGLHQRTYSFVKVS
jgi:hypothetical protein